MDDQENAIESIKYALEELLKLRDTAFFQYAALVNQVIENQITGERQLEQIMDGLLDFCRRGSLCSAVPLPLPAYLPSTSAAR